MAKEPDIIRALRKLHECGWVPLSSLTYILNYAHVQTLYARQRGPNPIPVIRVSRTNRVYEDTVMDLLNSHKNPVHTKYVLSLYRGVQKNV